MNLSFPHELRDHLRTLGVSAIYVFGSRAVDLAGPLSDFDFGVLMKRGGHTRGDQTYDALYDLLSPLCQRTLANDVIDIVFLNDAALELRMHVTRYGKILFEDDPLFRGRFEEKTMEEYCDFRPHLDRFDRAILAVL